MTSIWRTIAMAAVLSVSAFAADVTGKWVGKMETPNGSRDVIYNLKQDGEALTGSTPGRDGAEVALKDGSVKGDDVTFSITRNFGGEERKIVYTGKVAGKTLKLKFQMMDQDREITLTKE